MAIQNEGARSLFLSFSAALALSFVFPSEVDGVVRLDTSCSDHCYIDGKVEEIPIRVFVDLGALEQVSLSREVIQSLDQKVDAGRRAILGIAGNRHNVKVFQVSAFQLSGQPARSAEVHEDDPDFYLYARVVLPNPDAKKTDIELFDGRIGYDFFKDSVCFFNFRERSIYIATSLDELKSTVDLSKFLSIPMKETKSRLIHLEMETDLGPLVFLLDSGANLSVIRSSALEMGSDLKGVTKLKDRVLFRSCKMARCGNQFGPQKFAAYEFGNGWEEMDGVLGFDFLWKHPFCIDFPNRRVYFKVPSLWERMQDRIAEFFQS